MSATYCKNCGGDGYTSEQAVCPACNGTGKDSGTIDTLPAARNRAQAIAEVTKLPTLVVDNAADPTWVRTTPQASAVSWAFWMARKHAMSSQAALVLVALAQHATSALFIGDGYLYSTAADLAALLGHTQTLLVRAMLTDKKGHLWPHVEERCDLHGVVLGWRIPEEALNGNWLDRAARQAHYLGINENRKEDESPTTL